jgi:hypothetical protein
MKYSFTMGVPLVAMPLTHNVITEVKRILYTIYMYVAPPEPLLFDLPLGYHTIDELVDILNRDLLFGLTVTYSETQVAF